MINMRQKTLPFIASLMAIFLLAGCSGETNKGESHSTTSVGQEQPEDSLIYDPCAKISNAKIGNLWILSEEDGCIEPWPLTSISGILYCDPFNEGVEAIVYQPDEDLSSLGVNPIPGSRQTYFAVNGMATTMGYQEIDPIWKDNTESTGGPKVNIGGLINAGLSLCD
jgi:hypothetical protein